MNVLNLFFSFSFWWWCTDVTRTLEYHDWQIINNMWSQLKDFIRVVNVSGRITQLYVGDDECYTSLMVNIQLSTNQYRIETEFHFLLEKTFCYVHWISFCVDRSAMDYLTPWWQCTQIYIFFLRTPPPPHPNLVSKESWTQNLSWDNHDVKLLHQPPQIVHPNISI